MADSAVNHLRGDHQQARKFLAQLASLLDALAQNRHWTAEHRESFRKLTVFFEHELCLLIRKEDEILYPALRDLFPTDPGPLAVLRSEHRDLCRNFHKVCEIGRSFSDGDLATSSLEEFQSCAREAVEVLEDHLYKEERVLFPMVAHYLLPQQDAELMQRMKSLQSSEKEPSTFEPTPGNQDSEGV